MIVLLIAIAVLLAAILVTITPKENQQEALGLIYLGGFVLLFIASYQNGGLGEILQGILFLLLMIWSTMPTFYELWYGEPTIWTAIAFIPPLFVLAMVGALISAILEARHNAAKKAELP